MYDIAALARQRGLKTAMVSNGFIEPEPLHQLLEVLDAVKIDLKAFTEGFYEEITRGELEPVLDSLQLIREKGTWLEIVNLIIPTLNDDSDEIRDLCAWIQHNLGEEVPLHFSRFFPQYRMTHLPATPLSTLEQAHRLLTPGGLVVIHTIDIDSAFARLMGHRWPWLMEMHLFYFSRRTMRAMLESCGFEVLSDRPQGRYLRLGYLMSRLRALLPLIGRPGEWLVGRLGLRGLAVPVNVGDLFTAYARKT